jgi:PAS domain S-box-containing protein
MMMNILYVEDDLRDADLTRQELARDAPDLRLDVVTTLQETLACLEGEPPYDLLLSDLRLPDGDGLTLLAHVRERALPLAVVIVTGYGDEETVVVALKAGADDYVVKRAGYLTHLPKVLRDALYRYRAQAERRARPLRVLYAEPNASDADLTRRHLAHYAPHVLLDVVSTGLQALQRLPDTPSPPQEMAYDLLLLDYRLPGLDALEVLKEVRQVRELDLPVVLVTGRGKPEVALQAFKLGAADYLPKNPGYLFRLPAMLENAFHRAQLARQQAALRESEARYRTLFEGVPTGLYRTTPAGQILDANPALVQMLGYPDWDALLGVNAADLYVNPQDRERFQALMEREGVVTDFEVRLRRGDGSAIWVRDSARVVLDAEGGARYYEGSLEDITKRKRAEEELQQSYVNLQRALEGTIHTLVSAIEIRDPYTAGHQRRATQLACAIANEMALSEEQIEGLRMAGLIHDIGKISIPAEVLSKPGPLNDIEYGLIQAHPQIGHGILKDMDFPWPLADIVFQHHERLDGSGYPQGLLGEEIILEARILAVADVVEAMASHRPYRPARGIDEALEEISQNRGVLYDPEVVDACLKVFTEKGFEFE